MKLVAQDGVPLVCNNWSGKLAEDKYMFLQYMVHEPVLQYLINVGCLFYLINANLYTIKQTRLSTIEVERTLIN